MFLPAYFLHICTVQQTPHLSVFNILKNIIKSKMCQKVHQKSRTHPHHMTVVINSQIIIIDVCCVQTPIQAFDFSFLFRIFGGWHVRVSSVLSYFLWMYHFVIICVQNLVKYIIEGIYIFMKIYYLYQKILYDYEIIIFT